MTDMLTVKTRPSRFPLKVAFKVGIRPFILIFAQMDRHNSTSITIAHCDPRHAVTDALPIQFGVRGFTGWSLDISLMYRGALCVDSLPKNFPHIKIYEFHRTNVRGFLACAKNTCNYT